MVKVVILCGGDQQVSLFGEPYTVLEQTMLRSQHLYLSCSHLIVICNHQNHNNINKSLFQLNLKCPTTVILEPYCRNTGPSIAGLIKYLEIESLISDDDNCLVFPSDHVMSIDAFNMSIALGHKLIESRIVTFGVYPTYPEVEYGYIIEGENQVIERFIEKPNYDVAKQLIQNPKCYWNSGIYYFNLKVIANEYRLLYPTFLEKLNFSRTGSCVIIDDQSYALYPTISFDKLIMEKTKNGYVVPFRGLWSDIGSWKGIYQVSQPYRSLNYKGFEANGCHIFNYHAKQSIKVIGVDNLCVLNTKDTIIISPLQQVSAVKRFVQQSEKKSLQSTPYVEINVAILLIILMSMSL